MKREENFDFFAVAPQHFALHERLLNWARYVSSNGRQTVQPMFRSYRSTEIWAQSRDRLVTDPLDGHKIEKAVSALPDKHRDAIRWSYVWFRIPPQKMCRYLAVTRAGLALLVRDGRVMLLNRGNA